MALRSQAEFDYASGHGMKCTFRLSVGNPTARSAPRGRASAEDRLQAVFVPDAGLPALEEVLVSTIDAISAASKKKLRLHERLDDAIYMRPTGTAKATENGMCFRHGNHTVQFTLAVE